MNQAVIYARVSSQKQVDEGHGLESQVQRCQEYADRNGLTVKKVFEDKGVSGKLSDRPAVNQLLHFLATNPKTTILIDDNKRLARDVEVHLFLKKTIASLKCKIIYLNQSFEETPEGNAFETIVATLAQLEREQNARQVKQKMQARLELGYWVFQPPFGYEFVEVDKNSVLVKKQPEIDLIKEALEGFASGRFTTQAEVCSFFASKNIKRGAKKSMIGIILSNSFYAGFFDYPKWKIKKTEIADSENLRIISLDTHFKILERLNKKKTVYQSGLAEDFPLRGFLTCRNCKNKMTAGWSTSRNRSKYGYYLCKNTNCQLHNKSFSKDELEGRFEEYLQNLTPKPALVKLAKYRFDLQVQNYAQKIQNDKKANQIELRETENEISHWLDRIRKTTNDLIIATYESKIEELDLKRIGLTRKVQNENNQDTEKMLQTAFNSVIEFTQNPYAKYIDGDFDEKKALIKMLFPMCFYFDENLKLQTSRLSLYNEVYSRSVTTDSVVVDADGHNSNHYIQTISDVYKQLIDFQLIQPQPTG